jgi:hypothetical protein
MKRITYKQIEFAKATPNEPFYLVRPDTVQPPAFAAVHYPCEMFQADTKIWVIDIKREFNDQINERSSGNINKK